MTADTRIATSPSEPTASTNGRGEPAGVAPSSPTYPDLTEGSVPRNLVRLSWPQIVNGALVSVDHFVDLVWAGFLGPLAIAAIGIAQAWIQVAQGLRAGLDTASRAMVARAVGAGDIKLANYIAGQSFTFGVLFALLLTIAGVAGTDFLLRILGVTDEMVGAAMAYMTVQWVGNFSFSLQQMAAAVSQAGGDTVTPMKGQMLGRAIHVVLTPLFIFGLLGIPEMGLMGAALASAIAQFLGALLNAYVLFKGSTRLHVTWRDMAAIDLPLYWRMTRLGFPAAATGMDRSLGQLLLTGLIVPFGTGALAALSLTQRVPNFMSAIGSMSIAQAAGVMVGQNIGAGKPDRAVSSVRWGVILSLCVNCSIALLMFVFPTQFLTLFSRDAALIQQSTPWLQILCLQLAGMALVMTFNQCLNTAGETVVPMIVVISSNWLVQAPVAIMLSGVARTWDLAGLTIPLPIVAEWGEFGIPWAIVISQWFRVLVYIPYMRWGNWLNKQI